MHNDQPFSGFEVTCVQSVICLLVEFYCILVIDRTDAVAFFLSSELIALVIIPRVRKEVVIA